MVSDLKLEEILPNILWLEFSSCRVMCSTLLRFQEHYESPEFAGKHFSVEEFRIWYQGDRKKFTYYDDWSGFNIPSWVLKPFREGNFDPLSEEEKYILSLFEDRSLDDRFYIIGTAKPLMPSSSAEDRAVLQHETAHGLYYTNMDYQREVLFALKGLSDESKQALYDFLIDDYHENSIIDESHAYLLDGPDYLKTYKIVGEDINLVSEHLHQIYRKYR